MEITKTMLEVGGAVLIGYVAYRFGSKSGKESVEVAKDKAQPAVVLDETTKSKVQELRESQFNPQMTFKMKALLVDRGIVPYENADMYMEQLGLQAQLDNSFRASLKEPEFSPRGNGRAIDIANAMIIDGMNRKEGFTGGQGGIYHPYKSYK
jgi:hypothetical protein